MLQLTCLLVLPQGEACNWPLMHNLRSINFFYLGMTLVSYMFECSVLDYDHAFFLLSNPKARYIGEGHSIAGITR